MNAQIDISDVILTAERLILRPWRLSDLDDLYEYASVDGVGQLAGWKPHENREESREILLTFIEEKKTFALEYEGRAVGSLGIERYNEEKFPALSQKRCREIGFVLSKAYWGRGLMTEAVRRVIEYLFEREALDAILCGHFLSNHRSARVQEKCGFHHYAFDRYETRLGTVEDAEIEVLYREEYR